MSALSKRSLHRSRAFAALVAIAAAAAAGGLES
jgi:hypothetical protein